MKQTWQRIICIAVVVATLVSLQPLLQLPVWAQLAVGVLLVCVLGFWEWFERRIPAEITLQRVERFSVTPDQLVFAYGSLIVRESLLRTISSEDCQMQCIPAELRGFRQGWGAEVARHDLIDKQGRPVDETAKWAALVAEVADKAHNDCLPGAILGLTNRGLFALRNRERQYQISDVTRFVRTKNPNAHLPDNQPVYAFLPKRQVREQETQAGQPPFVRAAYFDDVSRALVKLGFRRLKKPDGCEIRAAHLVSDRVEAICRSRRGQKALKHIHNAVTSDLHIARETRETAFTPMPLCVSALRYAEIGDAAERTMKLCTKALEVVAANVANAELVRFGHWLDEDAETLRCAVQRGDHVPKIVRVDIVLSGNRLLVLELNCDSPGGMRHLDVLTAKQASIAEEEPRLDWIGGSATSACDAALDAILEAYRRQLGERATPTRALIVERLPKDWPTWPEMVYFRDEMISLGIETEIMDLESPEERLEYKSGTLRRVKGTRSMDVDLVYKRILWEDMRKCDEGSREALRRAYLDGAVCVVNSLGGRMAGSKMILAMLKCTALAAWLDGIGHNLTEEDRRFIEEHLPDTRIWGPTPEVLGWTQKLDRNDTLENPSPYVLKSYHGYGGKEVVIGCETKERPRAAFESCWGRGYVLQEFVPHGRAKVPLIRGQDVGWEYHNVVFGAYVINGQCVAIEAKTSPSLPINMARGAYRTAVFPVKSC